MNTLQTLPEYMILATAFTMLVCAVSLVIYKFTDYNSLAEFVTEHVGKAFMFLTAVFFFVAFMAAIVSLATATPNY